MPTRVELCSIETGNGCRYSNDRAKGGLRVTRDSHFELVSAVQRFICDTADAPNREVIDCAKAFVASIPHSSSYADRAILRSILFELAIEWGFRRHARLRSRCSGSACVPATLAMAPRHWSDRTRIPRDVFLSWVRDFCDELQVTHADPLADRAAGWIRARVTEPLNVSQMAQDLASNPTTIRRRIREKFQTTPRGLHDRIRVEYLESLLSPGNVKIAALAPEAGWKSKTNMYRAVRDVRGCTPGALKQRDSAARKRRL
jgi:AraC-like DNA-binding protein